MLNRIEEMMVVDFKGVNKVELSEMIKFLVLKVKEGGGNRGEGKRKREVLEILEGGVYNISEIGDMLGINSRNVSSVLSALKKDGYDIWNDGDGRKVLKGKKVVEEVGVIEEYDDVVGGDDGIEDDGIEDDEV